MTAQVVYEGQLRTVCTHIQSGTEIITDAPTDNHGQGEAFSPTDLVATALASCVLTTMGIKAMQMRISVDGMRAEVKKIMASDPRRISEINIDIYMPDGRYTDKDKKIMEHTAMHCPVAISLHPDMIKRVTFIW